MLTQYNNVFGKLLAQYNLPTDLSFQIELPKEVQDIVNDKILVLDEGITLKSFNKLHKASQSWENKSIIEDNENHFHVDWLINPLNEKQAFMLGIQTLKLRAEKFANEKLSGIRFWYSFQNPNLSQHWAKCNNLNEEDDVYLISDRISFYTRRDGEQVIEIDDDKNSFEAILIIDI